MDSIRRLAVGAAVLASLVSCTSSGSTSASDTPTHVVTVVTFDKDRQKLPVATFGFEQFDDGRITLKIKNIVDCSVASAVSFTFEVEFTPRQVSNTVLPWKNQGAVTRLAPGQTVDQGVIANSTAFIDEGEFSVVFFKIDYLGPGC